jgi:hypothetical protein
MAMRPVHGQTDRPATTVGEAAAFGAALAVVRGVLAHLSPKGGFGHGPVHPLPGLLCHQALCP